MGTEYLENAFIFINSNQTKIMFKPNFVQLSETTHRHTDVILNNRI